MKKIKTWIFIFCGAFMAFAQDGFATALSGANTRIWGYVSTALQGGLFIWFAVTLWKLCISRDKQGDWWQLLYLLLGILAIRFAPTLYGFFAGSTWTGTPW